jgi:hypothetical protein
MAKDAAAVTTMAKAKVVAVVIATNLMPIAS